MSREMRASESIVGRKEGKEGGERRWPDRLNRPDQGGLGTRASRALMRKQVTWTVCWTKCNFLPIQLEGHPSSISNKLPGGGNVLAGGPPWKSKTLPISKDFSSLSSPGSKFNAINVLSRKVTHQIVEHQR